MQNAQQSSNETKTQQSQKYQNTSQPKHLNISTGPNQPNTKHQNSTKHNNRPRKSSTDPPPSNPTNGQKIQIYPPPVSLVEHRHPDLKNFFHKPILSLFKFIKNPKEIQQTQPR